MVHADLIVKNAHILTLDREGKTASSFAVKDGVFLDIGEYQSLDYLQGPGTRLIDAGGATVLPGFNDAHSHLLSLRGQQLLQVDCSPKKVKTIQDIIELIRKKATDTPPGEWILAGSYDFTKLAEKRHPTRVDLDKATMKHPVHIRSQTCHIGVVNSYALGLAGIDEHTPDPPGGEFERDEHGRLTGVCKEEAHFLFVPGMGREGSFVPPYTVSELVEAVKRACREYNSMGITSVGDALVGPQEIEAYQTAFWEGNLNVRVYMIVLDVNLAKLKAVGLKTGFGNPMLRLGAIKSFVDGAIAGYTAWLSEPYGHDPDYVGIPTKTPEEIEALVMDAHSSGFQMEVHANGDRAISMVLDAYEKAHKRYPVHNRRHRIAHCTLVTPELLERIKRLGVVVLPFSTYIWEHGDKMGTYGDRISMMFPHKSFLDYGIPVGGSSDNPCATQNVLTGLQAMVTRVSSEGTLLGGEQRITLEQALRIYTQGSAYATFEEGIKGVIAPGMAADFIFLSADPFSVDPFALQELEVLKTFLGGKPVFEA